MEKSKLQQLPEKLGILGWEDIGPTFAAAWVADIPSVFIGDPGSAKTTFQERFARAIGLKVEILDLQMLTQTRLLGIPNPDLLKAGVLKYVGGIIDKKPDVVIFEELTRVLDHIQGLILEFLRVGRIDQEYLKCKRIANCNPPGATLVGVHYLDYAKATRIVHIAVPNLSIKSAGILDSFIKQWTLSWTPDPEAVQICQTLNAIELQIPPRAQLESVAAVIIQNLNQYNFSGRQANNLLRLLAASYCIEQAGLHTYTAKDIGNIAASLIPLQLTKHNWSIDAALLSTQVVRGLPDYPWKQEIVKGAQSIAVKIEELTLKFQNLEIPEIIKSIKGNTPENAIAFDTLMKKLANDPAWNIPFDNFAKF